MAGSARDVRHVVVTSLRAVSGVRTLVGNRIFARYLHEVQEAKRVYPLLTVEAVPGGSLGYEGVVQEVAFALVAWSQVSSDEASEVYEAARAALHGERLVVAGITPVVVAYETRRPVDEWDEGLQAWRCEAHWLGRTNG